MSSSAPLLGVTVSGRGPTLVLAHGLFGDRRNLGVIARSLSERFEVHSLDLPNHGESPRLEPGSIEQMADALFTYLSSFDEPVHYVGHSLGGKIGFRLVTRYPELVCSLVVLDIAPVDYQRPEQTVISEALAVIECEQSETRREADERLKAFIPQLPVRQFLLKSFIPVEQRDESGRCWIFQRDVLSAGLPLIVAAPEFVEPWQGPALVMSGARSDYVCSVEHEKAILEWVPNGIRQTVEGAGHWLHAEKSQVVLRNIELFLQAQAVRT